MRTHVTSAHTDTDTHTHTPILILLNQIHSAIDWTKGWSCQIASTACTSTSACHILWLFSVPRTQTELVYCSCWCLEQESTAGSTSGLTAETHRKVKEGGTSLTLQYLHEACNKTTPAAHTAVVAVAAVVFNHKFSSLKTTSWHKTFQPIGNNKARRARAESTHKGS